MKTRANGKIQFNIKNSVNVTPSHFIIQATSPDKHTVPRLPTENREREESCIQSTINDMQEITHSYHEHVCVGVVFNVSMNKIYLTRTRRRGSACVQCCSCRNQHNSDYGQTFYGPPLFSWYYEHITSGHD